MQDIEKILCKCVCDWATPSHSNISIFNVASLYRHEDKDTNDVAKDKENKEIDWVKQLPTTKPLHPERILDKKLHKKTRGQEYFQYLVKWKDRPIEDATWITNAMIQKMGSYVEELMERSPWRILSLGVWCRSMRSKTKTSTTYLKKNTKC